MNTALSTSSSIVELPDHEMELTQGGIWPAIAAGVFAYVNVIKDMKANPDDYTFLFDWQYE